MTPDELYVLEMSYLDAMNRCNLIAESAAIQKELATQPKPERVAELTKRLAEVAAILDGEKCHI